ncbi:shikimate dehydrogenase [Sphingomonas sp. R1]|uniref:shikimate dehydrogenase n=1 Tax=Sphingomonas sp. R1 TaxID=399176 RepID=UPI00222518EC|nr:shikimate dehydrogenase [Sphingomonas sp. R1]UYY77834.1 shikimate dehydrogenase [Sphingomonas sp. R1]
MMKSGLIGRSIQASRSPWLHEEEARAQGRTLRYALVDFDALALPDAALAAQLARLRDEGYHGFNVTYPFKQAVMPLLDDLAESARIVGAVNTVAIRDGRLTGHNTDMIGFRESLRNGLPEARLDRVLQVGAGGAGAAVANALLSLGVRHLRLADVDLARASDLALRLRDHFPDAAVEAVAAGQLCIDAVDGIVNATPIGMTSKPGTPIDTAALRAKQWVADIVYFPRETQLLREARAAGCAVLDGTGMVIRQAAEAFEIITGHRADVARMTAAFDLG